MKTNKLFMAFASGSESKEYSRKLYIGIAPVFVLGINPNKATLEQFFGNTIDEEPSYIGETEIGTEDNKRTVNQARLDFLVVTNPEKTNGIEFKTKISFFLKQEARYNKDKTKVQVIDKYGQTAWASVEEAKVHAIPQYASGPANLDADYRPAYIGEEELVGFIKAYLNIPNPSYSFTDKVTGEKIIKTLPNLNDALARLDNIEGYFKGNFKELESILKLQPSNVVKVLFGVRTTDENKQYQAVYTQKFFKNAITDYSKLDAEIEERKASGALSTTEFSIKPLKEYNVESTDFSTSQDPLGAPAPASSPWGWAQK